MAELVGLLIFASYFLSIFFLFSIILQSISERRRASGRKGISWSHANLALVSFIFTWYCECLSCVCGFTDTFELLIKRYDLLPVVEFRGL
jgi:hypothetical protein